MKIERMLASFPDLQGVYIDHEGQLKNYNMDRLIGIEVRVSMKPDEFAAFLEWKKQFAPPKREPEKPKEEKVVSSFGEHEKYAY